MLSTGHYSNVGRTNTHHNTTLTTTRHKRKNKPERECLANKKEHPSMLYLCMDMVQLPAQFQLVQF